MQTTTVRSFHFPIAVPVRLLLPPHYCCCAPPPPPHSLASSACANPKLVVRRRYSPPKWVSNASASPSPDGADISTSEEVLLDEDDDDGIELFIERTGKNEVTIRSKVAVNACLRTVWDILTDYERLSDFIPGLALSQLLHKEPNFARLFQIGRQNLVFGLKFDAKGIIDCYEKDLQLLPNGQRRDIEFKMIQGDFQVFEGKWSIEQYNTGGDGPLDSAACQELHTTLFYVVRVEPKSWLPVRLVESRLCKEIKVNLSCVRDEAHRVYHSNPPSL